MKKIALLFCMLCSWGAFASQHTLIPMMQRLQSTLPDAAKHSLNDSIKTQMLQHLQSQNAFTARLDSVPFVGSIYDADSTLRIVSWNYALTDGTYGCNAILVKKERRKAPLVHVLSTKKVELPNIQKKYTAKNWYGALYYRIVKHKNTYLLLGYTMYQPATRVKMVEVLQYDNNKPYLGDKIFDWKGKIQRRAVFEYGSMVQMLLHYDEAQKGFVFDHLSPEEPSMEGIRAYYGPDFSYDGLFYTKKKWTLQEDLDIKNRE